MVTFLSYISNACHSLLGVAERLQHTSPKRLYVLICKASNMQLEALHTAKSYTRRFVLTCSDAMQHLHYALNRVCCDILQMMEQLRFAAKEGFVAFAQLALLAN